MNNDFVEQSRNVLPWAGVGAAVGSLGVATTARGRAVNVWRPNDGVSDSQRYWCHGHSTGTYAAHNYSPFSGIDMATILADEWTRIDKKPMAGDILVFRARRAVPGENAADDIMHSARIVRATQSFGSSTVLRLSSKNGYDRLMPDTDLATVLRSYNTCYWFKIEQACCCGENRVEKQYYRRNL